MKYFAAIFSLYFLVLSIIPCTDIHATEISADRTLNGMLFEQHQDCPHEKEQDFCPPFCICNCCGQIFLTPQPFKFGISSLNILHLREINSFYYAENWQSDYLSAIFRPPQLG